MHIYINTVKKSRTARSDKNTNSWPKTFNKTVIGYILYDTSKVLQTIKKTRKSIFSMLFLKTFMVAGRRKYEPLTPVLHDVLFTGCWCLSEYCSRSHFSRSPVSEEAQVQHVCIATANLSGVLVSAQQDAVTWPC